MKTAEDVKVMAEQLVDQFGGVMELSVAAMDFGYPISEGHIRRFLKGAIKPPTDKTKNLLKVRDLSQEERRQPKTTKTLLPPSRQGKVCIVSHHDPAVAQQLKVLAATEGTTQQFLLAEALNLLFESRGLRKIADAGPRTRRY